MRDEMQFQCDHCNHLFELDEPVTTPVFCPRCGKIAVRTAIFQMPLIVEVRIIGRSGIRVLMPVSPAHNRITGDNPVLAGQSFSGVNRGVAIGSLENEEVRLDRLREGQTAIVDQRGNIDSRFHLQHDSAADFHMAGRPLVMRACPGAVKGRFIQHVLAWLRLTKVNMSNWVRVCARNNKR